jgi:transglutaminase-like putative cysteine protease
LVLLGLSLAAFAQAGDPTPADREAIGDLIAAAGTHEDHPGADVIVVFDRTEVDVQESGLAHVVNHTVTKILTEDGARNQATVRFDYDPATQALTIRRVCVHRANGEVAAVGLADLIDTEAPARMIYWGGRMQVVPLPRLSVGDAVEIETHRKGFQIAYLDEQSPASRAGLRSPADQSADGSPLGDSPPEREHPGRAGEEPATDDSKYIPPMVGHFYDVVLFQGPAPIKEKTYTLRSLRSKPVQYEIYNGEIFASQTFDDTLTTYKFWIKDVPAIPHEWRSPSPSDYVPKVVLATVQDWPAKSRWFFQTNDWVFADNPDIRAKVSQITKGLTDRQDIIAAINHWVAQEIRYCGLSMGQGEGYTIHPGQMIFNERSGVCKDIAGMAITMLRSAGFEVYPAMTMAGARVERIPADQFNHCVAALRLEDGGFQLLDPTWIPFAMNNWSRAEGEQNYVIGTPEGEDLMRTQAYTPQDNLVQLQMSGRIDNDGTLVGKLRVVGRGYSDTRLRRSFGFAPSSVWESRLANWLVALAPTAELTGMKLGDHRDLSKPLAIELDFRCAGFALAGQQALILQPCCARLIMANYGGLFRFAADQLPAERSTPALIWYPQAVQINEKIELPRGWRVPVPMPSWQTGTSDDVAACAFSCRADRNLLEIEGEATIRQRTLLPQQWPQLKNVVDMIQDIGQSHLVAKRKET